MEKTKMARTLNKKLLNGLFLTTIMMTSNVYAFDFGHFFSDLIHSKPGGKSVDQAEGKDLTKFMKEGQCPDNYPWGAPRIKDKQVNKRSLFICNSKFAVQFDPLLKVPLWSSEVLEKKNFEMKPFVLDAKFGPDDDIPGIMQQLPADYINSIYTSKSLTPFQNEIINNESLMPDDLEKLNLKAMNQTYLFSSTAPMVSNNLANTIWSELEYQTRLLAWDKTIIYVTTGVIYLNGTTNGKLPKSETLIPTHFYKIITQPYTYGTVSYIFPNKEIYTTTNQKFNDQKNVYTCHGNPCSLSDFVVPIQEVEKLTGIEFYPRLASSYAIQVKLDSQEFFKDKKKKQEKRNLR